MNPTPRTQQSVVFIVNPFGEREISYLALAILIWLMAVLPFGIFGAAMFAEPTIAEIEEVCGLVHLKISDFQISDLKTTEEDSVSKQFGSQTRDLKFTSIYLRVFGDSIRRTGMDMLLPDRQIFTFTTSPI